MTLADLKNVVRERFLPLSFLLNNIQAKPHIYNLEVRLMRCFVITKKQLMTALSLTVAAVILVVGAAGSYAAGERMLPIYCVETDKKQIAISFDAAWGNN